MRMIDWGIVLMGWWLLVIGWVVLSWATWVTQGPVFTEAHFPGM